MWSIERQGIKGTIKQPSQKLMSFVHHVQEIKTKTWKQVVHFKMLCWFYMKFVTLIWDYKFEVFIFIKFNPLDKTHFEKVSSFK